MPKIFVSTYPFGTYDSNPIQILKDTNWDIQFNTLKRKLKPTELVELAKNSHGLIAGTENLTPFIESNPNLKFISRVGIGLDSVPLGLCKEKGIRVSYTPDAVTDAVAELTIGLMIDITRQISFCDREIRNSFWSRPVGKRLQLSTIGIIGLGRVGKKVIRLLSGFSPMKILVNDIKDISIPILNLSNEYKLNIELASKEDIYKSADILSLHLPLYEKTKYMINSSTLELFNKESFLINTARGELINEEELAQALQNGKLKGVALDVFSNEPYKGNLVNLPNVLLTEHIGSCSYDCRLKMENESAEEIIRFFKGETLLREVPEEEYIYQGLRAF
jgi:D-3-phosphoglycerate dehydrogenase